MPTRKNREARGRSRKGAGAVRGIPPESRLSVALRAVESVLGTLDRPAALIGGMAVITRGYRRTTSDIDSAFEDAGFKPRVQKAIEFARSSFVLLLEHPETDVPIDVGLATSQVELSALDSRVRRDVLGISVPVIPLTGLIALKMMAGRIQDVADVDHVMHSGAWDVAAVEATLKEFDALMDTGSGRSVSSSTARSKGASTCSPLE